MHHQVRSQALIARAVALALAVGLGACAERDDARSASGGVEERVSQSDLRAAWLTLAGGSEAERAEGLRRLLQIPLSDLRAARYAAQEHPSSPRIVIDGQALPLGSEEDPMGGRRMKAAIDDLPRLVEAKASGRLAEAYSAVDALLYGVMASSRDIRDDWVYRYAVLGRILALEALRNLPEGAADADIENALLRLQALRTGSEVRHEGDPP